VFLPPLISLDPAYQPQFPDHSGVFGKVFKANLMIDRLKRKVRTQLLMMIMEVMKAPF